MHKVPVDIILCCYNQEEYISKAVESILFQDATGLDVRVIVADDCSKDKTVETIKTYEEKSPFPFLFLVCGHNLGINRNYERAFKECKGRYVAILEGDDWWSSPLHLQQHVKFLERHRLVSISMNRMDQYQEGDSNHIFLSYSGQDDYEIKNLKSQICFGNQLGNLSACVIRNKHLQRLPQGLFERPFADYELGIVLAQYGGIAKLSGCTSIYRINANSIYASLNQDIQIESCINTLHWVELLLNRPILHSWFLKGLEYYKNREWVHPPIRKKGIKTVLRSFLREFLLRLHHTTV